ncbi:PLP-dependent transferase [Tricholoma matsutake]|nr:PLP-dependent transferase [Tricholoma matsutake 945]
MNKVARLDLDEVYKQDPPPFGHQILQYFAIDPEFVNLNHGSFGATPLPVLIDVHKMSVEFESNPDLFHRITYLPRLNTVREQLAKMIGAETDECVLVTNAATAINTVLRNFDWNKEDVIVTFNTTYKSMDKSAQYMSDVHPRPARSIITLLFPCTHAQILADFEKHIRKLRKKNKKKIIVIIDAIISNPGVPLPWKEMVAICKQYRVWSIIDAAHSVGQELNINLSEAKPDFWVSNCHKWLYARRTCSILYVPKRHLHIMKSSLPTSYKYISSHDPGKDDLNFIVQHEWVGTIDFSPYLTVPSALRFREWLGGEEKINAYCHDLAIRGGKRLAEIFGTRVMDPDGELTLNMVNVQLPMPDTTQFSNNLDRKLNEEMLIKRKAYSAFFQHNGVWWTRCSAQVFTEIEDFDKLGKAWLEAIEEVLGGLEIG